MTADGSLHPELRDQIEKVVTRAIADEFGWESTEAIIHTSTITLISAHVAGDLLASGLVSEPPE